MAKHLDERLLRALTKQTRVAKVSYVEIEHSVLDEDGDGEWPDARVVKVTCMVVAEHGQALVGSVPRLAGLDTQKLNPRRSVWSSFLVEDEESTRMVGSVMLLYSDMPCLGVRDVSLRYIGRARSFSSTIIPPPTLKYVPARTV